MTSKFGLLQRYRPPNSSSRAVLWLIAVTLILPEIRLSTADWGIWGRSILRTKIYYDWAYWPGLLYSGTPNYWGQAVIMHLSYGILHANFQHMAFNVLTLFSIAPPILSDLRTIRFLSLYFLSQIGGALTYAIASSDRSPMVGASGALFGLAGALLASIWMQDRRLRPLLLPALILIALNIVMFIALDGRLAWLTHLGGFFFGAIGYFFLLPNDPSQGDEKKKI